MKYDVVILGGGAAGLFCAFQAGQRGRSVLVIEHNEQMGRKIAISGGGRCNFTNLHCRPETYLSSNPRFIISPLLRFTPQDFIHLVEKHKISYYEKKLGQLFCVESSQSIIQMLLDECEKGQVAFRRNCHVLNVQKSHEFQIDTPQENFTCDSLVIATGGLSIPKIGASDLGYRIARQFGIALTDIRPGLVPLTFSTPSPWSELQGISLESIVRYRKTEFHENVLFTHRGVSGPAILQISSYWHEGEPLYLNLLPNVNVDEFLTGHRRDEQWLSSLLTMHLPKRFAHFWSEQAGRNKPMKQYTQKELSQIGDLLQNWPVCLSGNEGFSKAEVTLGGVDTRELSNKTMESQKVSGLYFIGEVVDVTGHLGGYNFQWAWTSGYLAGQAV